MRRVALAMAGATLFVTTAAALSRPHVDPLSLALVETESRSPDANIEAPADAGPPAAYRPPPANPLWAIPISKLSATRDRPLFTVSRRALAPAVVSAPAPQAPMAVRPAISATPPFTLIGTIIGDKDRIAIFVDATSKISAGVREGESESGWTLRSVNSRSAVVEGSGRTVTLDLPEPETPESAPPRIPVGPKRKFLRRNDNGL